MSLHTQLLDQAGHLARRERNRPLQASLRRSVSASYYALVHFLIDRATRQMLVSAARSRALRDILSRAFEHGSMKDACRSFASGRLPTGFNWPVTIPPELRRIADTFVELQDQRHDADYNRAIAFTRADALRSETAAGQAISLWALVEGDDSATLFLTCLLSWRSLRNR